MRRLILLAAFLAAGCATRPQAPAPVPQPRPVPVQPPQTRGDLLGLTAAELDALHLATFVLARRRIEGLELLTADRRLEDAAGLA